MELSSMNMMINHVKTKVPYFNIKNEVVWGATAMILSEFIDILNNIPDINQLLDCYN